MNRCAKLMLLAATMTMVAPGVAPARPKLPGSHFNGVDEQGRVLYCAKIGDLEVSDNANFPLHIMFKSNWSADSPYLGKGWRLMLFESRIERTGERSYRLWQPDGWYRDFGCSKTSDTLLNGTAGWKGEIRGDVITVWNPSGWKLIFTKNKLSAMIMPGDIRLDLLTRFGIVEEVRAGAIGLLRVERDSITGRVKSFFLRGGKKIEIEHQLRPRVQLVDGRLEVKGEDFSLSKITQADGTVETYEYGVDDQTRPTLKIGDRLIAWNPTNHLIVRDGEWTYDIQPDEINTWDNAAIGRTNVNGEYEIWHYDASNGREIAQSKTIKSTKSWFVSGILQGEIREIKLDWVSTGKCYETYKFAYNEKGELIRLTRYDSEGRAEIQQVLGQ